MRTFISFPNNGFNKFDYSRKCVILEHIINDYKSENINNEEDLMRIHWNESIEVMIYNGLLKPSDFKSKYNEYAEKSYRCHMHILNHQVFENIIE